MNVLRFLVCLTVLAPLAVRAEECVDDYTECKDDCLIEFGGSIQVAMKKKFEKCTNKCNKLARRCNEREMTVRDNGLDEGSLDQKRGSDDSEAPRKKSKKAAEVARDDEPVQDEPVKKKEALRGDELPKSNRTELKSEDPPPAKKEEPKKEEPKQDVIEMKLSKQKEEEDLRDDKPKATAKSAPREEEEPPPPPKKEKKKEEPKKKEEDHDDLRYY